MAVRSAEKRLVLMTSRLDEASDRERIPSQFFLRAAAAVRGSILNLKELVPEIVPGLRLVNLDDPGPGKDQPAVDKGEIRLGMISANPGRARTALAAIADVDPLLISGPLAYDHSRWMHRLTGFDGCILDPPLRSYIDSKLLSSGSQISASRMEEYAKCPYMFYLRRVQELEKWDEYEQIEGLDPLERGKMVHGILENFTKEFSLSKFAVTPAAVLRDALTACAIRELESGRPALMPDLLWEIERERLLAMLQNWLVFERERNENRWQPAHMERSFGAFPGAAALPALRIAAGDRVFEFRGRIDRIDISSGGHSIRIIDYKTGVLPKSMRPGKRTLLMGGEKIQLAVYCGAASAMADLGEIQSMEAEYLHLQPSDGEIVPCSYEDSDLRKALLRLPGMLEIIDQGISSGIFFARTCGSVRPEGHCRFCDFLTICGKDRQQRERIKSADPAVRRFARLQEIDEISEGEE